MRRKATHQVGGKRAAARVFASAVVLAAGIAFAAQAGMGQWSAVGGDSGNTRYSSLAQINEQNVAKLGAAWVSEKFGPAPTSRAMPVIDNGLMILTAPPYVYAVNLSTGKIAWRYNALPGGTPAREGVAVGEGLVFVGLSPANLVALAHRRRARPESTLQRRSLTEIVQVRNASSQGCVSSSESWHVPKRGVGAWPA